jgi:hypothetical protein
MPSLFIHWGCRFALALAVATVLGSSAPTIAATLLVPEDHTTITAALLAATDGDSVVVGPGTYSPSANGEAFPLTLDKAGLHLIGAGMGVSILDAQDSASALLLDNPFGGRVEGFTITGGRADRGGGLHILDGDFVVAHNMVWANGAKLRGSGMYVGGTAQPHIHHNVVWESYDTDLTHGGDPHGIQMGESSGGLVAHNLVGRGDSNGLFVQETGAPTIRHNIFLENGDGFRGRGICHFGTSATVIAYNLFHANSIAALIVQGTGNVTAAAANDIDLGDGIYGNLDGDPLLRGADAMDFRLWAASPAIDAGDPGLPFDTDGTVADLGPFFYDQSVVGAPIPDSGLLHSLTSAPNPFNPRTTIRFVLEQTGNVDVTIYDPRGRRVRALHRGEMIAGEARLPWDGRDDAGADVVSGVYLVSVLSAVQRLSLPVVLVR